MNQWHTSGKSLCRASRKERRGGKREAEEGKGREERGEGKGVEEEGRYGRWERKISGNWFWFFNTFYRTVGNFWRRKLSWISLFCSHSQIFSAKFRGVAFFGAAKASYPRKSSPRKLDLSPIHETFPLYGMLWNAWRVSTSPGGVIPSGESSTYSAAHVTTSASDRVSPTMNWGQLVRWLSSRPKHTNNSCEREPDIIVDLTAP